ncbi:hypothetical protein [Butyricimonas synergistica]|nr:hypothetical protein [Butyricimonas synergistica]
MGNLWGSYGEVARGIPNTPPGYTAATPREQRETPRSGSGSGRV